MQTIWDKLIDETMNKAIIGFRKRLDACVIAGGTHFEHRGIAYKGFVTIYLYCMFKNARNLVSWFSGKLLKLLEPDVRFLEPDVRFWG